MNKATSFLSWHVLLVSLTAFTLASCRVIATITPVLQSPTIASPYIHYIPSRASNIHVEFDYPSSWTFNEEMQDANFMVIGLGDPRFLTMPTRTPNEPHGTPSDFGSVRILVVGGKPGQTLDTLYESYKQGHSDSSWITELNDHKININGYDASVLEYQVGPTEFYTSLMFERDIFFVIKDQMYQITFLVAEKERGGEFEKGYEYFFNSLKLTP